MKKLFTISISLLLYISFSACLLSQGLNVVGVNPYHFPEIRIKFHAVGSGSDTMKTADFSGTDIWVTENGKDKFGTVECPEEQGKFSLIIVCDISGSMNDKPDGGLSKMDLAKQIISQIIDFLPLGRFECAILAYHQNVFTIAEFTDDKSVLHKTLKSDTLTSFLTGRDINSALLWDLNNPAGEGALLLAKNAKYKPYIVLIAGGGQSSTYRPNIMGNEIQKRLNETESELSLIAMFPQEELAPSELDEFLTIFPHIYWNPNSPSIVNEILKSIYYTISVSPCIFTFETDCSGGGDITFNIDNSRLKASETLSYTIPETEKNILQLNKNNIKILNTLNKTESVIVVNHSLRIAKFIGAPKVTDESFKVINPVNWPGLEILPNNTLGVQIEYTNPVGDSTCHQTDIILESNSCKTDTVHVSAGWIFGRQSDLGKAKVNEEKTVEYKSLLCNHSCEPLTLYNITLHGADNQYFRIKNISYPVVIESGDCFDITFGFKPVSERDYTVDIAFETSKGIYESIVTGRGVVGTLDADETTREGNEPFIMIHPNPTSNNLIVNISLQRESDINMAVLGIDGRTYLRDYANNVTNYYKLHNLSFLPAGVYILQITTGGRDYERTFIKN